MNKVGITTIIGDNYGSVLQDYALQKALVAHGVQPHLISLRPRSYLVKFWRDYFQPEENRTFVTKQRKLYSDIKNRSKRKKAAQFYRDHLNLRRYRTMTELVNGEKGVDGLICGSDQIWNPAFQPNPLYYLSFADENAKKYSYAASLAVETASDSAKEFFKIALTSFRRVSVREETGKSILIDCVDRGKLRMDCDPVLLLEKKEWEGLVSSRYKGKHYLLFYMLRPSKELIAFATDTAKEKKLDIVFISDYAFNDASLTMTTDAGVEDFLSAIYYADYVVTNSFHATVFSTIFQKPFSSQAITRTGSRVRAFLLNIGLHDRIVDFDGKSNTSEIDYSTVEDKLFSMRERSLEYINEIVQDLRNG